MIRFLRTLAVVPLLLAVAACQQPNKPQVVLSAKSPVELRAMQSRAFDTADRTKTMRAVVATLQDLGYTIDQIEPAAGTVGGTKLSSLRLTTTIYPRGESQTMVRANAMVMLFNGNSNQVDDPVFYQQLFFEPLSKAMFLSALQVEDDAGPLDNPAAVPAASATSSQGN